MKLLTLNAHSLQEENYPAKLRQFVDFVIKERPDVIALQEVNQTCAAPLAGNDLLRGMAALLDCSHPVRQDNHAANVAKMLYEAGVLSSWVYLPIKLGYGKYDEGVAILSLAGKIEQTDVLLLSDRDDYANWKTRKVLGVQIAGRRDWFYTVHMGWWGDSEEPFDRQFMRLEEGVAARRCMPVWLMGDFNSPAEVRGMGYDLICENGWQDEWLLAGKTEGCATVPGVIDGWRDKLPANAKGMRIDHIFCSRGVPVSSARVVFSGTHEPQVSDHFGILMRAKGEF